MRIKKLTSLQSCRHGAPLPYGEKKSLKQDAYIFNPKVSDLMSFFARCHLRSFVPSRFLARLPVLSRVCTRAMIANPCKPSDV